MADTKTGGADMMGSRADMISHKIDEVSRNQIWREHVVKEAKLEGPLVPFQFNPRALSTVALKPTQCDPRAYKETDRPQMELSELDKKINENSKPPQQKYEFPSTESQAVGWMHDQAWKNGRGKTNIKWYRGKGSCDVTRFSDAYCTMAGCSPFADKSTR